MRRCRIAFECGTDIREFEVVQPRIKHVAQRLDHYRPSVNPSLHSQKSPGIHCFQKDNPSKWHKGEREVKRQ